eukprot:CAMPEP_0206468026 /NCGR_PEP_ID=MMETSP0324_2-20121206/29377_1 /ASSEMBLY_ACC=CAM_ASM_000836 /TAXON_ID=2866 /ORGANISM="Crypthecodinium cohnii, Strain Seligo" /LENGTH=105 /DNA_ID=CAMNT_0053941391 /DNA_START=67 /DNA_END=380 /DNA_ORIENTATION=-
MGSMWEAIIKQHSCHYEEHKDDDNRNEDEDDNDEGQNNDEIDVTLTPCFDFRSWEPRVFKGVQAEKCPSRLAWTLWVCDGARLVYWDSLAARQETKQTWARGMAG